MITSAIKIVCALTRLDTCVLVFLSLFLPVYFHSQDLFFSSIQALPVLTICMCGFVINDLSDIEKDRTNHPLRPLPSNAISETSASIVYFLLLAISLITIKLNVDPANVYLYILLLVALINYNFVVAYIPILKTFYVAIVSLIPIFILSSILHSEESILVVAISLFMFLLGREMLMDVEDVKGDAETFVKKIGVQRSENIALSVKLCGSLLLSFLTRGTIDIVIISLLAMADFVFIYMWKKRWKRKVVIQLMKLQLLAGIYFLMP